MGFIETKETALPRPEYIYVTKEEDAHTALNDISKFDCIALDTECTDLDPFKAKLSLLQIGTPEKTYVFDTRFDTPHSSINIELFKPILTSNHIQKIIQNAVFDMKLIKAIGGFYVLNIYDTMLVEQLFNLGKMFVSAALDKLVLRYLGLTMPKEPATTFKDYYQTFKPYQLEYAANDVVVLPTLKDLQMPRVISEGLEDAVRLEFEFTKPMCEMELNGIKIDVEKWRLIMSDIEIKRKQLFEEIGKTLSKSSSQQFLFGVPSVNIDSPAQLKTALEHFGLSNIDSTDEATLKKFQGIPVIEALLKYRKATKLVSTYGEALLEKIHPITGRLHTEFKQMVSTGRMSSANPNLQNIPKKQLYRSCFIAEEEKSLITADMSGAELRILGNLSQDPVFIECYANGIDLHTRTASEVFGVPMESVKKEMRNGAKAINFGLCLQENTNIITDLGINKIKNTSIDSLACHDTGQDKVIDKQYMGEKEVFEIKTQYGYTLEATEDHLMKIINSEGEYVDKVLKDLDIENNYICLKRASNIFSGNKFIFNKFEIEKITNYKHFELPKFLDEEWASFFGLFVAEGSISKVKGRTKYSLLQFGFSDEHREFIEKIDKLLYSLFGDRLYRVHKNGVVKYSFNSVLFCEWLAYVCGVKEKNKTNDISIPGCIKKSPKKIQVSFLRWLFEGDGSVKTNGKGYSINYSSKSQNLIKDLQLMLLNFGVLTSIRFEARKDYPGELYWELRVVGDFSRNTFVEEIGFVTAYKNDRCKNYAKTKESVYFIPNQVERIKSVLSNRTAIDKKDRSLYDILYNCLNYTKSLGNIHLKELSKHDSFFKFIHDNNIVPLPIKSIKSKGVKRVYDISVENHQYFLANGFIVHNCYGLSKYGLARRLKIPETKADQMIKTYFQKYSGVKGFLEQSAKDAVMNRFSRSVSGRKRYYRLPEYGDPEFRRAKASVERQAKNAPIQGSNADTIKQSMIYLVDRLEKSPYEAKLILTVHDEVVVECAHSDRHAVGKIVAQSLVDGFGHYFHRIPMETDALIGPCWLKSECENCGGDEMVFKPSKKYKTKLICKKCGEEI